MTLLPCSAVGGRRVRRSPGARRCSALLIKLRALELPSWTLDRDNGGPLMDEYLYEAVAMPVDICPDSFPRQPGSSLVSH